MLHYATLSYIMLHYWYIMLQYATLLVHCATSCYIMLHYATLCYIMLHYASLLVQLCDLTAPVALILRTSRRPANLSDYLLETQNIIVHLNSS